MGQDDWQNEPPNPGPWWSQTSNYLTPPPPQVPSTNYAMEQASQRGDVPTQESILKSEGHSRLASLLVALSDAVGNSEKASKADKVKKARGAK
jgi:hypothetical protein